MSALAANGEPVRLDVNEQNRLSKGVTRDELTRMDATDRDAFRQIRTDKLVGVIAHFRWSRSI